MEITEAPETPVVEQVAFRSKRDDAIAKINANIEEAFQQKAEEEPIDTTSEQEEKQLDEAVATLDPIEEIKERKKQEEENAKKLAQQKKEGIHNAQTAIRAGTDAFKGAQETTFNAAEKVRDTASGAWNGIGRIAIPGSIWLPVAILLIFFFLLLPVNGYTRAQWLWLAITGSAQIESGGGGAGGGGQMSRSYTGVSVV